MPSEKFAGILKEMLCLRASLDNNNRIISLDQLPDYLRDAIEQKRALDAELESLRVKTEEARSKLEDALRTSETTIRDIEQFIFVREELKKTSKQMSSMAAPIVVITSTRKFKSLQIC
jgi:multidrug resistance efflux pump